MPTVAQLESYFREQADDTVAAKYLWSSSAFLGYLNEAEAEVCIRKRPLIDTGTYNVSFSNGTATYSLNAKVLFVRRLKLSGTDTPLGWCLARDLDASNQNWQDETGSPTRWVSGLDNDKPGARVLRVTPVPTTSLTGVLTAVVLPASTLTAPGNTPTVPAEYHYDMVDWCLARAYDEQETDKHDPEKAKSYRARFDARFGTHEQAEREEAELLARTANRTPYADGTY